MNYTFGLDFYSWDWKNHFAIGSAAYPNGYFYIYDYDIRLFNSDLLLQFHHQFKKDWKFNLTLGNNLFEEWAESLASAGNGLELPGFYNLSNSPDINSINYTERMRRAAFFGNLELGFKDMVYLTLTGRNDWSTTLSPDNNSFFYPSASISWIFTELDSFRKNRALPFGKLMLSYSIVANDPGLYMTSTYYTRAGFMVHG